MSDTDFKSQKPVLLTGLIFLLIAVVAAMAWYMADIKQQLNGLTQQQSAKQSSQAVMPVEDRAAASTTAASSTAASSTAVDTNASSSLLAVIPQAHAQSPQMHDQQQQHSRPQSQSQAQSQAQPQAQQAPRPAAPGARPRPDSIFDDDFFSSPSYDAGNWNPYEEIQRMQRDMDRMFNNAFSRFNESPDFQHLFRQGFTTPQMDVQEDDDKYTVIVNLPGSSEKDVSVHLDGQTLTIQGEQRYEKQDKDSMGNIIFQERRSGSFQRSVTLPGPVKQAGMKTRINDGVLTVTIPKDV